MTHIIVSRVCSKLDLVADCAVFPGIIIYCVLSNTLGQQSKLLLLLGFTLFSLDYNMVSYS